MNKRSLALSIFPTSSSESRILYEAFVPIAEDLGFDVNIQSKAQPIDYVNACRRDDVVVVDATIEPNQQHNYELIAPLVLDHVLVISRTYLPLNFYGLRNEIWDGDTIVYGSPPYPKDQTNDDILYWLQLQLQDMLPELPRPKEDREGLGSLKAAMTHSLDAQDRRRRQSGEIFISYRSRYHNEIAQLQKRVYAGEFHNGNSRTLRYFPPGVLADIVMTEQRRWQILSMLDRFLMPASEVWVYETEDYYDSWWTLGELATLAYRKEAGYRGQEIPQLKIFDPKTHKLRDAPNDYLPSFSKEQGKRLARWYANCDTLMMGPESVVSMRMLGTLPLIKHLKYFKDHVWTNEFWDYPILDCYKCREIGHNRSHFDIDAFLWHRDPGISRFSPTDMQKYAEVGKIVCPHCKTTHQVTRAKAHYLWSPIINDNNTAAYWKALFTTDSDIPDDTTLIPLLTYKLC